MFIHKREGERETSDDVRFSEAEERKEATGVALAHGPSVHRDEGRA